MTERVCTIAHVFATFSAGGPQVRAVQLMRHMGRAWRHVVMAMDGCTEAAARLPDDLDVAFVPPPPRAGFVATVTRQRRWLREIAPDLVLTYNWGAIESTCAARRLRLPLVHHEEGFGPGEVERRHRRRNWIRRVALRAVPVIVPSEVLQGIARREWRLAEECVHLLPNGVDLERFGRSPVRTGAELTVGTVGRLRGEKDHAMLLGAFAQVSAPARLRIVGGGELADALCAQAVELGIGERTEFVGAVSDTAPEYARMDVFVLPSRTEQMPIALLEAMASGCAVVSTDVGDVRVILPDVQQPFVVPAGQPTAMARAMAAILDSADLRARLGLANRERVEQRYEAHRCLDRYVGVYEAAARR